MDSLRKKAESIFKKSDDNYNNLSNLEMQKLIEEFQIHQIELSLQNQELRDNRAALEIAKSKYFNLFDKAPIGYMLLDKKGIINELNLKASEIFNRRKDYMISKTFVSYLDSDYISVFYECFENFQDNKSSESFVLNVKNENRKTYIELSLSKYDSELYLAAIVDVTARKLAEQLVEQKNIALNERIKELQCIYGITGLLKNQNLPLNQILKECVEFIPPGWQFPEITCAKICYKNKIFTTSNYQESKWKLFSDLKIFGKISGSIEILYMEEKPLEATGPFLQEEVTLLNAIVQTVENIIELNISNIQITESEEKYRNFVEYSLDAFVLTDESGNIVEWNKAQEELSGIPNEYALGKKLYDIQFEMVIPEMKQTENLNKITCTFEEYFKTGNGQFLNQIIDIPIINKSGKLLHTQQVAFSIKTKNGFRLGCVSRDITLQKNIDIRLKYNEDFLKKSQALAHVGSWELDVVNNILIWSDETYRIFGYKAQEIAVTFNDFIEIVHPDDREAVNEAYLNSIVENKDSYEIEHRITLHNTSETKYVYEKCEHIRDSKGNIIKSIGMVQDITSRIEKQNKILQYSNQLKKLSIAVEQSPVTIVITDSQGNIEYVNPAFCKTTGYCVKDAIGVNPRILKTEKTPPETFSNLWETISSGKTWVGEFVNKKKSGEYFHEEAIISPVFDSNNNITSYIAIKTDITLRKQQEELIKLNNERLEKLLELSHTTETDTEIILNNALDIALLLTKSKIGYIYHYNEDTELFTLNSWSKDVMKECLVREKQTVYNLNHTGIWGEAVRQRKPILINDFKVENSLKKGYPEGHVAMSRFLTIPVFEKNEIIAVIGVGNKETDYDDIDIMQLSLLASSVWSITNKKEDELKIKKYADELKESNATKDKFFSIIAHDLKNPFQSILGFSELLLKNVENYDVTKIKSHISKIYTSANNTFKLLNNLLDWARLQRGIMPFSPDKLHLILQANEVLSTLSEQATAKDIQLINNISDDILIIADSNMFNTSLRNLITNAIKFSYPNSKIELNAVIDDNFAIISVKDTGTGIESSTLNNLFSVGQNISKSGTQAERGTGLGLILCKEFVEKNGGKIWAESEVGKGSVFYFSVLIAL